MSTTAISAELIAAYESTDFVVLEPRRFVLKIGLVSRDLLAIFADKGLCSAAFITAFNPYSEPTSSEKNLAAQARLEARLGSLACPLMKGVGVDPSGKWPGEPSILALGIARQDAERIGREFRQNAIVWIGPDGVPELVMLNRPTDDPVRS